MTILLSYNFKTYIQKENQTTLPGEASFYQSVWFVENCPYSILAVQMRVCGQANRWQCHSLTEWLTDPLLILEHVYDKPLVVRELPMRLVTFDQSDGGVMTWPNTPVCRWEANRTSCTSRQVSLRPTEAMLRFFFGQFSQLDRVLQTNKPSLMFCDNPLAAICTSWNRGALRLRGKRHTEH